MARSPQYDCIIIGSGCGGAGAAALAAHRGWKTLVLEKNKIPGGRCATYDIRGFKMDHGHLFGRSSKGPHGKLLRQIGCGDLVPPFANANNMHQKRIVLDKTVEVQAHSKRGFLAFYEDFKQARVFKFSWGDWFSMVRIMSTIVLMSRRRARRLNHISTGEWISKYTDNIYLRSLFGAIGAVCFGALPDQASVGELIQVLKDNMRDMFVGYPINGEGSSAIPKSFLRAGERYGAEIRLQAAVDRIVVEQGRVTGVEVNGVFIATKRVISNAGFRATISRLVGEEHFEPDYVERIKNLKYSYGGISLKYALKYNQDKPLIEWGHAGKIPENFDRNMRDAMEGRVPEEMSMLMVCTSNIDSALAPAGKQTLLVITPGPAVEPGSIDWRPWKEKAKSEVSKFIPGLEEHTLFCVVSTPDVIAKQAGRTFGDAVGVAQTIDQVGDQAPKAISPIEGLYYVGADIGSSGIATEMATQSAMDLFKKI